MLTFCLYILPILGTLFCSFFYIRFVDRETTRTYIPRLARWIMNICCFIPIVGWLTFGIWLYVFSNDKTEFKKNKITDFFINN